VKTEPGVELHGEIRSIGQGRGLGVDPRDPGKMLVAVEVVVAVPIQTYLRKKVSP
jgi:hypothetical protein